MEKRRNRDQAECEARRAEPAVALELCLKRIGSDAETASDQLEI
jgi:hypothetical protein